METVIYLLIVCLIIFLIVSLLPIILPIVIVVFVLVTIFILYARYKLKKNMREYDENEEIYFEENFDTNRYARDDQIIDVEYSETQEDEVDR